MVCDSLRQRLMSREEIKRVNETLPNSTNNNLEKNTVAEEFDEKLMLTVKRNIAYNNSDMLNGGNSYQNGHQSIIDKDSSSDDQRQGGDAKKGRKKRRRSSLVTYITNKSKWLYEPEYFVPEREKCRTSAKICGSVHELADSLFSTDSGFTNYRGLLNLGIVLLVLSFTRSALENLIKYGILIKPFNWGAVVLQEPYSWPSFSLVLLCNVFILITFYTEVLLSKNALSENLGLYIHIINLTVVLIFPAVVILYIHPFPLFSSIALSVYTVTFLKLISYAMVNGWCREGYRQNKPLKPGRSRYKSYVCVQDAADETHTKNGNVNTLQQYPDNLYLGDIYYFMAAPTLCYELNFPRSARVRKRFLIKRALEMVFLMGLMISLVQQWIVPTVHNAMVPFKGLHVTKIIERIMKLAVPNHIIWLMFFYWLFHSCLNVVAELLKFGDRVFYRDWWNSETVSYFWQNWNIPVHRWASRHLYKPLLSRGWGRFKASITVFVVSAFFHEYLVSIPLRMFRLWAFTGMLVQVPFALFVNKYLHGKYGNMAVWLSLIVGQPIAILMYYHDYYIINLERLGWLPFTDASPTLPPGAVPSS